MDRDAIDKAAISQAAQMAWNNMTKSQKAGVGSGLFPVWVQEYEPYQGAGRDLMACLIRRAEEERKTEADKEEERLKGKGVTK